MRRDGPYFLAELPPEHQKLALERFKRKHPDWLQGKSDDEAKEMLMTLDLRFALDGLVEMV